MNSSYNKYKDVSKFPYYIFEALISSGNEKIFNLLYYNNYNALNEPYLTRQQKIDMVWKDEAKDSKFKVFLKPLVVDEILAQSTQLRINKYHTDPLNNMESILCYEFMIITGQNIAMVDNDGIPCPRIDVLEEELLSVLNGLDLGGVGTFQFNDDLSSLCKGIPKINNGESFFGNTLVFALRYIGIEDRSDTCG